MRGEETERQKDREGAPSDRTPIPSRQDSSNHQHQQPPLAFLLLRGDFYPRRRKVDLTFLAPAFSSFLCVCISTITCINTRMFAANLFRLTAYRFHIAGGHLSLSAYHKPGTFSLYLSVGRGESNLAPRSVKYTRETGCGSFCCLAAGEGS